MTASENKPRGSPVSLSRAIRHKLFLYSCNHSKNLRTELAGTAVGRLFGPGKEGS